MTKLCTSAQEALSGLQDRMTVMCGGFGLCGIPEKAILAVPELGVRELTVISNNIGNRGKGLALWLQRRLVRKAYCSYVGGNPDLEAAMLEGRVEVELVPQGTLAERIRAAGAGIRAFYTPTGVGTQVAEGKELRAFDRPCLLETALTADFALIKAEKADPYGNLYFREAARNFSPLMAMAARCTVVEVESLVELGDIPPEQVHLPGIFVNRLFCGAPYENAIEYLMEAPL